MKYSSFYSTYILGGHLTNWRHLQVLPSDEERESFVC